MRNSLLLSAAVLTLSGCYGVYYPESMKESNLDSKTISETIDDEIVGPVKSNNLDKKIILDKSLEKDSLIKIIKDEKKPKIIIPENNYRGLDKLGIYSAHYINENLDGSLLNADYLKDKVVLLDFWATWCSPCVAELPNLESTWKKYKDKGVVVIGVCSAEDDPRVHSYIGSFIKEKKITFPIIIDDQKKTFKYFNINEIPDKVLIDKGGQISDKPLGQLLLD